jgi:tetratricopeptide (TPR) repeat protein
VAPLLPGADGCLVLVTSRRHLADLPGPVVPVHLQVLDAAEAAQMFLRLAPRAADQDQDLVAELAGLAGFLPLALSLLARVYARHPAWGMADLTSETRRRLLTLTAEQASVTAAFEVSWQHLNPARQGFLALLGVHPAATLDPYAAAALAGVSLDEAAERLDGLHGEGLLTETAYRRYGMHDLIRQYAGRRAQADLTAGARAAAIGRLLDYYQVTAAGAEALLSRHAVAAGPAAAAPFAVPDLAGYDQALAWLRAERASALACLDHAAQTGQPARVVALTAGLAGLFQVDGPWADAIARHGAAARAAGDAGDRRGQARALLHLGEIRRIAGDCPAAVQALTGALDIYRDLGDRAGRATTLASLGYAHKSLGDYLAAARQLEQALDLLGELDDRRGQAYALRVLGEVRMMAGDFPASGDAMARSLALARDSGDRRGQAYALAGLGWVRRYAGDFPAATRDLAQALAIYRDLGHRVGQANVLRTLGDVRRHAGDLPAATTDLAEALAIFRDVGIGDGQANALLSLGGVRRLAGDYPAAARDLAEALAIYQDTGDRGGAAEALNETAALHLAEGDHGRAAGYYRQALELARELDSPFDEAQALAGLGRCARAAGHAAGAVTDLARALEIFRRIGAAEVAEVAAELEGLAGPRLSQ